MCQNDIPVFCPALTDGSLGDMMYFHTFKTDAQLSIDIVADIRRLNDMSVHAKQAGMIVLGGGVCKHQIANAMLFVSPCLHPTCLSEACADSAAQRCRLRRVYKYWARGTSTSRESIHLADEAVRRIRFWSKTRRSCLLGQDPGRRRERQGRSTRTTS